MSLRALDLFSGIGGFSYALRSVAQTVAYCEIQGDCHDVLQENMGKQMLHEAPIYDDVTKLTGSIIANLHPTLITAGFPCQDISVANPDGCGLQGAKSGLFKEVMRLVDELPSIQLVFLENSSAILNKGFTEVQAALNQRGFVVAHCCLSAKSVGAKHKRTRWFALCYRKDLLASFIPLIPKTDIYYKWSRIDAMQRVVPIRGKGHKEMLLKRCKMLGNSIVPQCAAHAWNSLVQSILSNPRTDHGVSVQPIVPHPPSCNLVLDDGIRTVQKDFWGTPTHSTWHNYRCLTNRSLTVLSNQLYYEQGTNIGPGRDKKEWSHTFIANPQFIECLMGYPKNWTRI